jgi:hypothetical protein
MRDKGKAMRNEDLVVPSNAKDLPFLSDSERKSRSLTAFRTTGYWPFLIPDPFSRQRYAVSVGFATWSPLGTPVGAIGEPPVRSPFTVFFSR